MISISSSYQMFRVVITDEQAKASLFNSIAPSSVFLLIFVMLSRWFRFPVHIRFFDTSLDVIKEIQEYRRGAEPYMAAIFMLIFKIFNFSNFLQMLFYNNLLPFRFLSCFFFSFNFILSTLNNETHSLINNLFSHNHYIWLLSRKDSLCK